MGAGPRFGIEHRAIPAATLRESISGALDGAAVTDAAGQPLRFTPHDFRRMFITDAVLHGMPPHIAQLVAGHRDINTTMGYKAVYPDEVINGHRAFIARRRELRPSDEYRVPTEQEWEEFLGHFERRKLSLGTCARPYATPCIHEHACLRCPLLRPDPAQRHGWPRSATTCSPASPKPARRLARRGRRAPGQPGRRPRETRTTRPDRHQQSQHPPRDAHLPADRRTLSPTPPRGLTGRAGGSDSDERSSASAENKRGLAITRCGRSLITAVPGTARAPVSRWPCCCGPGTPARCDTRLHGLSGCIERRVG